MNTKKLPRVSKKRTKKGGGNNLDDIIYRLNVLLGAFKKQHHPDQTIMEGSTIIKALNIENIDDLMELKIADIVYDRDKINQSLEGNRDNISRCIRALRNDINEEKEVFYNILKNTFRGDGDDDNIISMINKLGLKKINDMLIVKTDDVNFLSDYNKQAFHKLQEELKKKLRIYILLTEAGFLDHEAINICKKLELIDESQPLIREHNENKLASVSKNIIDKIDVLSIKKKGVLWRWIISYILKTELDKLYDDDTTKENIIKDVEEYLNNNKNISVYKVSILFTFTKSVLRYAITVGIKDGNEGISHEKAVKDADKVIKLLNPDNVLQLINYNVDRIYRLNTDMNTIIQILELRDALETTYIDILYIIAKAKSDHIQFLILMDYIKPLFSAITTKRIIHRLQLKSVEDLISTDDDVILKIFPYDEKNMKGLPRNKNIIEAQIKRLKKLRDELKSKKTKKLSSSKKTTTKNVDDLLKYIEENMRSSSSSKKTTKNVDDLLKYIEENMRSS